MGTRNYYNLWSYLRAHSFHSSLRFCSTTNDALLVRKGILKSRNLPPSSSSYPFATCKSQSELSGCQTRRQTPCHIGGGAENTLAGQRKLKAGHVVNRANIFCYFPTAVVCVFTCMNKEVTALTFTP